MGRDAVQLAREGVKLGVDVSEAVVDIAVLVTQLLASVLMVGLCLA